jgi:hypothetical protein
MLQKGVVAKLIEGLIKKQTGIGRKHQVDIKIRERGRE